MSSSPRISAIAALDPSAARLVEDMLAISVRGLPAMWRPDARVFGHSLRQREGGRLELVGSSPRYTAIVAIGAAAQPLADQRRALSGITARELASTVAGSAPSAGLGDLALCVWAAAETANGEALTLARRLVDRLEQGIDGPTVEVAWALTALAAAHELPEARLAGARVCRALLAAEAQRSGIFPHRVGTPGGWRGHVGCFADQVYPIQALARWSRVAGEAAALDAAARCAARICALQGDAGQWWWHYDSRSGELIEGYPVYSVHQDAMAPMALLDLADAGGPDHRAEIARGLRWLEPAPELGRSMLERERNLIWRKVARREPNKLSRGIRSAVSRIAPRARLRGLDRLFPPRALDAECRPYHLGWLLHTWPRSE